MLSHYDSALTSSPNTMETMATTTATTTMIDQHPLSSAFQRIPDELQIKILGYLTVQDLLKVTGVCHNWYNLVHEGSLWKTIDITPFYRKIPADQLLKLGLAAGSFLKVVNFRGCIQLTSHMLRVLSDHCGNVESLYLKDCRGVSTPSIACFLQRATRLTLLDLSGLDSVKNSTLQIIGQYLPHLTVLNISWCKNVTGQGVQQLVSNGGKCHALEVLKLNGTAMMDETTMAILGSCTPNLRKLSMASCSNLTDAAFARLFLPSNPPPPLSSPSSSSSLSSSSSSSLSTATATATAICLSHLNLSNCPRLSDRSLKQLALHGGEQLTHLELAGCDAMTDTGFTFMAPRLRSLIHLDLEDIIHITGVTIKALANNQPNLRRLCLSNCTLVDDDAIQFLVLHGTCKQLEHLELDGCAITDVCLDTIATFLVDQYHERRKIFSLQRKQLLRKQQQQQQQQQQQKPDQRYNNNSSNSNSHLQPSSSIDSGFTCTATSHFFHSDVNSSSPVSTYLSSSSSLTSSPVSSGVTPSSSTNTIGSNRGTIEASTSTSTLCHSAQRGSGFIGQDKSSNDRELRHYDDSSNHTNNYDSDDDDNDNDVDDDDDDDDLEQHRTLMLETLDCGNISESGVRSALAKAEPFLVVKSFYSWMDTQRHDDQDDNNSHGHSTTFQQQRRHHPDARQHLHASAGRFRGGARTNRHLTAGQSHSSGCVIL